jgi:hypothetical protein
VGLAAVLDDNCPKVRPFGFLAESCATDGYLNPETNRPYAPRYSRDLCGEEKRRQVPDAQKITRQGYWRAQAEAGQPVPARVLRQIRKKGTTKRADAKD